jgi:hypothetical protein
MRRRGARVRALDAMCAVALLTSLAGCAARPAVAPPVMRPAPPIAASPVPPPTPPADAPAGTPAGTPVGTTASGGVITTHTTVPPVPAVVDSAPSEDALAVLHTIPEPLGADGTPDSVRVPVPSPTQPLGDREGTRATAALPETLTAPPSLPTPLPPPATTSRDTPVAPGVSISAPDSCWRVQVLAPPERERADRMAEAARSQLLIPFVIEREGGLFKVRSRDCMSAGAASDLRRRAEQSGFAGAFRFQVKPR